LIVETKDQEDLDVALKDRRARRWCEDATRLSGREWGYEKVPQKLFDKFDGDSIDSLRRFLDASKAAE
jgi:type III restriction enzyme